MNWVQVEAALFGFPIFATVTLGCWKMLGGRARALLVGAVLVSVPLNPVAQFAAERAVPSMHAWSEARAYALRDRAESLHVVGMTQAEVRQLLGRPWATGGVADGCARSGYTKWVYQATPGLWMATHLRVFFDEQSKRCTGFNLD